MSQPRDDLSHSLDALSAQVNEDGRDRTGPGFDAIRGQAIPEITYNDEGAAETAQVARGRRGSDTKTERSQMTVWDRGESLHSLAFPQGTDMPNIKRPKSEPDAPLARRLLTLRCQSKRPKGTYFFPWGSVEALINEDEVVLVITQGKGALSNLGRPLTDDQIREYAKKVCTVQLPSDTSESDSKPGSYRKIFAILVLLGRGWEVVLFVDEGISDAALPLKAVYAEGEDLPPKMRLAKSPQHDLSCISHWDWLVHEDFERHQWSMLSPFFAQGKIRRAWFYQLSDKDILPWVDERIDISTSPSGYSNVYRIKIHESHHNFPPSELSDGTFAVKIFKPDRASTSLTPEGLPSDMASLTYLQTSGTVDAEELKEGFKREIETLRRFSGEDHPHLISLLAAFRHGDDYCVIFRWARCDLKTLWRDSAKWNWDPDPLSKPTLQWMLEQCRGIASGLHRIHRYTRSETMADGHLAAPHNNIIYGRHGDIKPENILVFCKQNQPEDRGTLVITDFGLTRFHTEGTKSYFSSKDVLNTFSYRPPECDMEECRITQSFDIWSFGCVLLEFIAWYLGGWALVLKFVRVRKTIDPVLNGWNVDQFFEAVRPEGETEGPVFFRVKLEVHQFVINELHAHPKCSEPIHKLLDYIMTHMLVVVSRGVQQRDDSSQVHTELDKLCKMVAPPEYKLVPSPRKTALAEIPIPEAVEMPLNQIAKQNTAARFNQLREHTGRTRRLPPHSPRRTQTHPPHGN